MCRKQLHIAIPTLVTKNDKLLILSSLKRSRSAPRRCFRIQRSLPIQANVVVANVSDQDPLTELIDE